MNLDILNTQQKKAVLHTDGPLLIVAGAGTGKTTVITQKIAYLIEQKDIAPESILALTFTEKAAAEMHDRVDAQLDLGYTQMQISTFHAFCQRILEIHGLDIGLPNRFSLLTQTDAWLLMRKHMYSFDLDYYRPLGNPNRHIHELLRHFSKCKDELISPEAYVIYAENLTDGNEQQEKDRLVEIAGAYARYNQLLIDTQSLDFGDLIYYTVQLLKKRPAILKQLQTQFQHILVDEFQDVNWAQYQLVRLLAGEGNLTVVGDDDQSIYAFRGASVANILRFKEDYPNATEVVLNTNYRSGQKILDTAYASIQENNPDRLEVKLDIDKKLTAGLAGLKAEVSHLHVASLYDEVRLVIERIAELKTSDDAVTWDDIAILVRANAHAKPFIEALESADIPYEYISSAGLFRQPVVMDAINLFKIIDNTFDSTAMYRLLRLPSHALAEKDLSALMNGAKKKSLSYFAAIDRGDAFHVSAAGMNILHALKKHILEARSLAHSEKPSAVLYRFLESSSYITYLTNEEEKGNRDAMHQIFQLKQFFEFLAAFESAHPDASVHSVLEHISFIQEAGDEGKLYQPQDTPDSVNIMTIHGSKGLEFKYVFVVNMVEDRFPSRRKSQGIELPLDLINEQLPEGDYHIQEERRLFYVAMTRAKEHLFFSSATDYGGTRVKKLSRFLVPLGFGDDSPNEVTSGDGSIQPVPVKKKKAGEDIVYPLPKTFSYSQIRSYQTCPYQYKLAHILKIPMRGSASFSFGNTMHNTLQHFYEEMQSMNGAKQVSLFATPAKESTEGIQVPSRERLHELYQEAWISDWYNSKRQREDYHKKGLQILNTFYDVHEGKWNIPLALEGGFTVKVGPYSVRGKIDRVDQQEDGTLEIIDYKTGKAKEKLVASDKDQLLIYQIAAQSLPQYRHVGEVSKLTFYYLNEEIRTSFMGTDKDLKRIEEKITKTLDAIHKRNFTASPSKHVCGRCDFRDICEYRT